ncbi:MAG: PKD domain-containing protein [Flavobacteriales bacterium]|nr:PKD domain-containing protein [Flavobacteriales bacterium]
MKRSVSLIALVLFFAFFARVACGQSLFVPGGANYVEVGDLDVAGSQITVEAIVTMTGAGVNIVSKHTDQSNVNYLMRPGSVEITTTNGYVNAVSGFTLNVGECYHLAFTYDGASLNYYVNGCLASSTPHTGTMAQNNLITAIGNRSNCQCETWLGYIDEVRIWNVARTQAQIQANMMDLPAPTTQPGLLAYYKFDGNYTNLQGNPAWNGTVIGAPQLQNNTACTAVDLSFQNSVAVSDVSCFGGSDGTVTITSAGGHPNYTYSADGINYSAINSVPGLPAGNGVVFAQSGANSGCMETIPITISQPTQITTSITGTDPTNCTVGNGTANLTVNGGTTPYSYLWSTGSTVQNPTNLVAGLNTVTITDANQCTATTSITLGNPPGITASISNGTDVSCNGGNDGSASLTVNGALAPINYSWSTGSTQQNPTNLVAGTNTVSINDANNCTAQASVVLNEPTPIFPNAYANYVSAVGACDGGGFTNPSGGTPPYTYSWDNGQTTQIATGMCIGPHTITVTDANGCTGSQVIIVNVPACLTDVDFYTWVQAGIVANGNWVVQNAGARIHQTINGNPTFFVTPVDYINVRMKGKMRTTDSDDDFMGVVFGFKNPLGSNNNFDTWLFDWKQGAQTNGGFAAQEGFALSHAVGTIPNAAYAATFWGHTNTPEFTVAATNYGNNGWTRNVDHEIEVTYTVNRAIILVDGDTIFDIYDCFEPGRFGFYNYSQQDVYYSDFTYELFADFTINEPEICAGDTAHFTFLEQCGNFNNLGQFSELKWNYGDNTTETFTNLSLANVNPTHVYQSGGNYTVQLIVKDTIGCRDTIFRNITVWDRPTADFIFTDQCLNENTIFTDQSAQSDYPITIWNWDFGDNATDNTQNPIHQYATVNMYNARLIVEDSFGCRDTLEQAVEIYPLPQADFTPIDDCFQSNYPFEDVSTITSGTVDSWQWDFGDVATSIQQNPTHTYSVYGQYDVTLIALSDQGCGDTTMQQITLHAIPIPGFEVPNICQLEPISIADTSSISEGTIVAWNYDFGDNTSSIDQNPTHTYLIAGSINIQLTVTSDFGCVDSLTVAAIVDPKPAADFATQNVCLNETMVFADQTSVASGSIAFWDWNFGDTNTDAVQNTSNDYNTFGNYTVTLMVETDNGCSDTTQQQVEVFQLPVADFSFSNVCLNASATFTDQSTSNSGSVDTWNWDLGDNTSANGVGPIAHLYSAPADYDVELIVETDLGCLDTIVETITIHPMPVADFTADSVCLNEVTTFTNLSFISTGTITNNVWDFGFSATSTLQNPTHTFPQTGYLPVFLTVTSDFGCKDTITKDIRIYVLPEPEFTHNDTCFEDIVSFINQSQISEGTIDVYDWDFGDLTNSNLQDPTHAYPAEGFYQATLLATSNFGCVESVSHQVEIFPLPQISYTPIPNEGCQPLTVVFDNNTTISNGYNIASYHWDLGHGISSSQVHPQTIYPDSGFYDVQLIATSTNGCDDTLLVVDAIDVWPRPIAGFSSDKDEYIMFFPRVDFSDESFGATEWLYDFADGSISLDQNPSHEYQEAGNYQVIQTVNNDYGCDDETSIRVIVKPAIAFYIPNTFTPNADGLNETFAGNGVGLKEYEMWIFDRWGENLFYSSNMEFEWNGTYKGKQVESGMYIYRFVIVDVNNEQHQYNGEIFLMR